MLLLLAAPLLVTAPLVPGGEVLATASSARSLMVGLATLAASCFLYLHWRLTASEPSGWLSVLLAVPAVSLLALGALELSAPDVFARQGSWLLVSRIVVVAGLIVAAVACRRLPLRGDPLVTGLVLGLTVAGLRHVLLVAAPALPPDPTPAPVRIAVLGALAAAFGVAVSRLPGLPTWVRLRVAVGLFLLGLGSAIGGTTALLTGLAGAVLLAGTAAAVLHQAIDEEKREVEVLHERLDAVEVGLREDRARLHEIDATVAGIASAQQLMGEGPASERSDALAAMVRAEVARLQRLVAARGPVTRRSVDLDDVVGQIVLAHLARGRRVAWQPTGLRALARSDDVAEILNVLLENAAVHGGSGPVDVRVVRDISGSGVTLTVADRGPGVAPELRDRLFDWGVSRAGSPGQGIGLHAAAEIAHDLGGRLELLPKGPGAWFALHLPAAPGEVVTGGRIDRAS